MEIKAKACSYFKSCKQIRLHSISNPIKNVDPKLEKGFHKSPRMEF